MKKKRVKFSNKKTLHIFSTSKKFSRATKEHYPSRSFKTQDKRPRHFKQSLKKSIKKFKQKFRSGSRKHPRTTREHTDFGKLPHKMTCPNCLSYIETDIYYYKTGVTHAIAASLSPICLCMLPCCIKKFKNAAHYCPRCSIFLGTKFGSGRNIFFCCAKS